MMRPLVSIALTVLNAEKTLAVAIRSICDQTFEDWELIVLDDGSTDSSLSIAGRFGDPRIKVFSDGRNRGIAARLNQAMDLCRGEYFARMDADDVSSRPKEFPTRPGELFPVYHLLREFAEFKGGSVRQVDTSDNLAAVALALHKSGRLRVLVGNLTGEAQTVTLRGFSGKPVDVEVLGAKKAQATPELSISLPPYGIARIDQGMD